MGNFLAILANLYIYHFTAKAFAPSVSIFLDGMGNDYFTFLIIGEIGLLIPMGFQVGLSSYVKFLANEGVLENIMVIPRDLKSSILTLFQGNIFVSLFHIISTLILAYLLFGWSLSIEQFGKLIMWFLFITPLFYFMGIFSIAYMLFFGKMGATFAITTIASVIGGTYFPVEVLPEWLQFISGYISPFTPILQGLRYYLFSGINHPIFIQSVSTILCWTVIFLVGTRFFYKASIIKFKKRGAPLIPLI